MTGFKIDDNGDVVIENEKIQIVSDTNLIAQTVRQVLKTNLGEWWLNESEGIDFKALLAKQPNEEQIQDNILLGLRQVDESFRIESFSCDRQERNLIINFSAENSSGTTINITI